MFLRVLPRIDSQTVTLDKIAKISVIGCGYWGKNLIRNFAQLGVLRLICDSNEKSLQTQAALYPQVEATNRFEQVLSDRNVQGVVLATPAAMHFEQVKQALNAG